MPRDAEAVLIGPGYFYVAEHTVGVPEAKPTMTTADVITTDPAGNWVDVGYTEEGWNLVLETEMSFWMPAELVDFIASSKDSQTVTFRGVMAQFTLETLITALGGGSIAIDTAGVYQTSPELRTYTPPASDEFARISALFRTKAPLVGDISAEQNIRDIYIPQVISITTADIPHNKGADNPSLVAVELRGLKMTGLDVFEISEQRTLLS